MHKFIGRIISHNLTFTQTASPWVKEIGEILQAIDPENSAGTAADLVKIAQGLRNSQSRCINLKRGAEKQHDELSKLTECCRELLGIAVPEWADTDELCRRLNELKEANTPTVSQPAQRYILDGDIVPVALLYQDEHAVLARREDGTEILTHPDAVEWYTEQEYHMQELVKAHCDLLPAKRPYAIRALNQLVESGHVKMAEGKADLRGADAGDFGLHPEDFEVGDSEFRYVGAETTSAVLEGLKPGDVVTVSRPVVVEDDGTIRNAENAKDLKVGYSLRMAEPDAPNCKCAFEKPSPKS